MNNARTQHHLLPCFTYIIYIFDRITLKQKKKNTATTFQLQEFTGTKAEVMLPEDNTSHQYFTSQVHIQQHIQTPSQLHSLHLRKH